jgi:hypothetical protein
MRHLPHEHHLHETITSFHHFQYFAFLGFSVVCRLLGYVECVVVMYRGIYVHCGVGDVTDARTATARRWATPATKMTKRNSKRQFRYLEESILSVSFG